MTSLCTRLRPALLLLLPLAACAPVGDAPGLDRLLEAGPIGMTDGVAGGAPPDAAPGTCWGRQQIPAIVETQTRQRRVQPGGADAAATGPQPPVYRTETRQTIVQERREIWFEALCDEHFTPVFTASLQRALAAREVYPGAVTGHMDAATRQAVRRYQRAQGLDSAILSLVAARQLGLVALDLPAQDGAGP